MDGHPPRQRNLVNLGRRAKMNRIPKKKGKYFYQLVAGTKKDPAGVCNGYFTKKEYARMHHTSVSGYVRRVWISKEDIKYINVWQ